MTSKWRKRKREEGNSSGGGGFRFTAPDLPQWKPEKDGGEFNLDFFPTTAGKKNKDAKKGEKCFEFTYFVHNNIGPKNAKRLCNLEMFGKPCFVCEYQAKKFGRIPVSERTKESKQAWARLKPQERQLFIIQDADKPKKGLHWFEYSNYAFGQHLLAKIENAKKPRDQKIRDNFADPKKGATLQITGIKKPAGDGHYVEMSGINFVPRTEPLDSKLVKKALGICLDDLFKPEDYKEVKKLFLGATKDEDEDEEEDDEKDWEEEDEDEDSDDDEDEGDSDDDEDDEDSEDDSEDEDSDDDKDSDDDDEDEDSDDDESDDEVEVGDTVKFKKKGKRRSGVVKKIKNGVAKVKVKGMDDLVSIDLDLCKKEEDDSDEDDSDEDEDSDDEPRRKKKRRK